MHHIIKRATAFTMLSASIVAGAAGAQPAAAADPFGVLQPVVANGLNYIQASPFVNSTPPLTPGDIEGLAYDPARKSLWIADDSKWQLYEVSYVADNPNAGVYRRTITHEKLKAAPQFGNPAVTAGAQRAADIEGLAFSAGVDNIAGSADDEIYAFAGSCCVGSPHIPTVFRLVRDGGAANSAFKVADFQPLSGAITDFSGAAALGNVVYVGSKKNLHTYDYATNTLSAVVGTLPSDVAAGYPIGDITGMDFNDAGNELWVTTSNEKIVRLTFPGLNVVPGYAFDSRVLGIPDSRAVEVINDQVVIPDGFDFYPPNTTKQFALYVFKYGPFSPVASFTAAPTTVGRGGTVTFQNTSTSGAQTLSWDFGDGSAPLVQTVQQFFPGAPALPVPFRTPPVTHVYPTSRALPYTVTLTATNPNGSTTATQQIVVTTAPAASFDVALNPATGLVPATAQFTDLSTGNPTPDRWLWNFGDGTPTSTAKNPSHVYLQSGKYTVTLTVSNADGSSVLTKEVNIVGPPTPSFTEIVPDPTAPLTYQFTSTSTGNPAATSYKWEFGDGDTVTTNETSTTHQYARGSQYTVKLTATNQYGSATVSKLVTVVGKGFVGINPARVLDTRDGGQTADTKFAGGGRRLGAGTVLTVPIGGRVGIPLDAGAVALNVTAIDPTAGSYLTVWPDGVTKPDASNLNYTKGQTIPNMVIVKLGANGNVSFFNESGQVDLAVDVLGFFPANESFYGINPERLLDTRPAGNTIDQVARRGGPVGAGKIINIKLAGRGSVPADADAVALNVTAVDPTAASYLTVWPRGSNQPDASNLNFGPGRTIPNMVIAKLSSSGEISIFNESGDVNVLVDVLGWFPKSSQYTYVLRGVTPARLVDTRQGGRTADTIYAGSGGLGADEFKTYKLLGRGGLPNNFIGSVALNVTVVGATGPSYLTVWPGGQTKPNASNLNYVAGSTIPNMVIVPLSADGTISVYNESGKVDVLVDVLGYLPV